MALANPTMHSVIPSLVSTFTGTRLLANVNVEALTHTHKIRFVEENQYAGRDERSGERRTAVLEEVWYREHTW
jgi:hypothetical protein